MRLGILPFGARSESEPLPVDALKAAEIDVVPADAPVSSVASAGEEAARLHRADCDGCLLFLEQTAPAEQIAAVALSLASTPLLLWSERPGPCLDAAGVLDEIGVGVDRRVGALAPSDLMDWLRENSKIERQRGYSAARKLFGQRMALDTSGLTVGMGIDAAQWLHQFGIAITNVADAPTDDASVFAESDGDAYGALTRQILTLIGDGKPVYDLTVGAGPVANLPAGIAVTAARLSRRQGHFQCVVLTGITGDAGLNPDCDTVALVDTLASARLHALEGAHIGALRAACAALDIECTVLRPAIRAG